MINHKVKCSNFEIANNKPFTLIAGPCQLEDEARARRGELISKKIWPCYFFKSDTTGEKGYEI